MQSASVKSCQVCGDPFAPFRSTQRVCGAKCARQVPIITRKAERAETKARREALKSLGEWTRDAQTALNAYIRFRDRHQSCICCGKPFEPSKPGGSVDAGHYLSIGSAVHLRFDERNVHAQRKNCNRPGGTTRAAFRAGMIARIGLEAVEALEADQTVKQYRADDLKGIRDFYRTKLKLAQIADA
jgi:predicted nucleic acid-binding Zn ribbon protein